MAGTQQHRLFHLGLKDFLVEIGVEPTKENLSEVKWIIKRHLGVRSVAALSDEEYREFIWKAFATIASEFGIEVPKFQAEKSMRELLNEFNTK